MLVTSLSYYHAKTELSIFKIVWDIGSLVLSKFAELWQQSWLVLLSKHLLKCVQKRQTNRLTDILMQLNNPDFFKNLKS